jgi:gamma-glutamylcyclotransferase (GGCT)/AIG2-like uncharacterized protein YtfP
MEPSGPTVHPLRSPTSPRTLDFASAATVRGHLHDLGEYPGLVLDDSPDAPLVPGDVFLVADGKTLAAIDEYEGFRAGKPETSIFQRTHVAVILPDGGQRTCWVYVYNGEVSSSPIVH